MSVWTLGWLTFLTLIRDSSCSPNPFELEQINLTAVEGSCIEIKCKPGKPPVDISGAKWFWLKDPIWTPRTMWKGTLIKTTDESDLSVSPRFKNRIVSKPLLRGQTLLPPEFICNMLLCDLVQSDSGKYLFRYEADKLWATRPMANLTVTVSPNWCPVTFKGPTVVKENDAVTLTCSTWESCSSNLQVTSRFPTGGVFRVFSQKSKNITHTFNATWEDNKKVFLCQTTEKKDKHVIRKVRLAVLYAPKNVTAHVAPRDVKKGGPVTFTCTALGNPLPTYSWFKGDTWRKSGHVFEIKSTNESDSGTYYCKATNKLGTIASNRININVLYAPEVKLMASQNTVDEGSPVTFTCIVIRSNPANCIFAWTKDGVLLKARNQALRLDKVKLADGGNYTCTAINSAGQGTSKYLRLNIEYKPRRTKISINGVFDSNQVKVYSVVTLTCDTDANPAPSFAWYKESGNSSWKSLPVFERDMTFERVNRTDKGCYKCNPSNRLGAEEQSVPACMEVLFPPTKVLLFLDTMVKEGQSITVTCSAESFPPADFNITTSSRCDTSPVNWMSSLVPSESNVFNQTFIVTFAHTGCYVCEAANSEGRMRSKKKKLQVEYPPKEVKVRSLAGFLVRENESLSLECGAYSYPPPLSYTWRKKINNATEVTLATVRRLSVKSVAPSDSGVYTCSTANSIGTNKSKPVEIKVKYAPKQAFIFKGQEQQSPSGERFVILTCSSFCYPPAKYMWYNKTMKRDISTGEQLKVFSHEAGVYYCVSKNEMGEIRSESIRVFDEPDIVPLILILVVLIMIIAFVLLAYRTRRNKLIQQGQMGTGFCWVFRGTRSSRTSVGALAKPSRGQDDLLPDQRRRPKSLRKQPSRLTMSSADGDDIYSKIELPKGVQKPVKQQHGQKEDDSLNYASLHFKANIKGKDPMKSEEDVIYSAMAKPKPAKERDGEQDYVNVSSVRAKEHLDLYESDPSISGEQVEVNYAQVKFKAKPGHQSAERESSSSEDDIQYSTVKI